MKKPEPELQIEDDHFLSVNLDGILVKKNFDYYLLDKEEINTYIGRDPTYINQILRVPFHGTLELAYFFIGQLYPNSKKVPIKGEEATQGGEEDGHGDKPMCIEVYLYIDYRSTRDSILRKMMPTTG